MNCLVLFDLAFFTQIKPFKIDLFYWIQCVCETAFWKPCPILEIYCLRCDLLCQFV